jgi:hypothetical protein
MNKTSASGPRENGMRLQLLHIAGTGALLLGISIFAIYMIALVGVGFGSGLHQGDARWYPLYAGIPLLEMLGLIFAFYFSRRADATKPWRTVKILLVTVWCLNAANLLLSFTGLFGIS